MKLEFTEKEINTIFAMLGRIPYAQSVNVINYLQNLLIKQDEQKGSNKGRETETKNVPADRKDVRSEKKKQGIFFSKRNVLQKP